MRNHRAARGSRMGFPGWAVPVIGMLLAIALAAPATADIGKGNGEIGIDIGVTGFDSKTPGGVGFRGSIRGGYHFTNLFQLEGQVAGAAVSEDDVDTKFSMMMVNGVFNFHTWEKMVPYFYAGAGVARLDVETPLYSDDDHSPAFQLGGGCRFFFGKSRRMALRLDVSGLSEKTFDETAMLWNATVGVTWRIGAIEEEPSP